MTNEVVYTIGDLAEAASVTPRTVRYYTAEGLLPPPDTRGRYAVYNTEHLERLLLIARLKAAYLPLSEIKARMHDLSAAQVGQLLAEYRQPLAPSSSAADYISQVLAAPAAAQLAAPAAPRMLAESTPAYAQSIERAGAGTLPSGLALPLPEALPAAEPPAASAPARGLLKLFAPRQRDRPAAPVPAADETWQRVAFAPGVELHVRTPLSPDLRARVEQLIERAQELFHEP